MAFFNALPSALTQGLIWGIMAIGIYITYKILDVSDLTVDGSFCTGGCACVMLMIAGCNVWVAMLGAFLAGMLTDGEACPVCGSLSHPAPALLSADAPTEAAVKAAKTAGTAAAKACVGVNPRMTKLVIRLLFLGVAEYFIRLVYFFELFFRLWVILIDVGMILLCLFTVSLFNLVLVGTLLNP